MGGNINTQMTEQQQKILDLAKNSLFLSIDIKEQIEEKIEDLGDGQLEMLEKFLVAAEKKQSKIFEKILEKNPEFIDEIKNFITTEIRNERQSEEKISNESEKIQLQKLEKMLEQI